MRILVPRPNPELVLPENRRKCVFVPLMTADPAVSESVPSSYWVAIASAVIVYQVSLLGRVMSSWSRS